VSLNHLNPAPMGHHDLEASRRSLERHWLDRRVTIIEGGLYGDVLCPAGYIGLVTGIVATLAPGSAAELLLRVTFDSGQSIAVPQELLRPLVPPISLGLKLSLVEAEDSPARVPQT
jgi:hypothetical protein